MNRPKPKHRIIGGIEASMENIGASFFVVKLTNSILLYYQKMSNMAYLKQLITSIVLMAICASAEGQIIFSDSTQISILTCSMGADSYERFGHTGVRINDLKNGQDIVFHWGVYDFDEPCFVLKFIKGITDYQIGACYTSDFIRQYKRRGLGMKEQKLNLDSKQRIQAIAAILDNYRPENRKYRYNFFFDNCSTRPFDVINAATDNAIEYDTTWVKPITLRDMLQEKTSKNNWLDFGISLAVATRSDQKASFGEQMFLPDYLMKAYDNATIGGRKLVEEKNLLLETTPETQERIDDKTGLLSPNVVFSALLIFVVIIVIGARTNKSKITVMMVKATACIILASSGITGSIIWFLNFFSLHPAVDHNVNCLWLLPTNIIFAALIWVKSAEKVNRIYFFIIFALIFAYAIINNMIIHQYINPAFWPLLGALIVMSGHHLLDNRHEEELS